MPARSKIGINQAQGGSWYPFWRPSDNLDKIIADIYVHFVDTALVKKLPFKIEWLYGFGTNSVSVPITPAHDHDIKILDYNGVTVFDSLSATSYAEVAWGSYKTIIEWKDATGNIVRVVKHEGWDSHETPIVWDDYFEPTFSWISPRAVEKAPAVLTDIQVATTTLLGSSVSATSGLILSGGYNTELTGSQYEEDGERRVATISIDGEAGAGSGKYPGCATEDVVRYIGGAEASDTVGTVFFNSDNNRCYRIGQAITSYTEEDPYVSGVYYGTHRTATPTDNTIKIENDCIVCCDCPDFIAVYEGVRKLTRTYTSMGLRAEIVRDRLARIIDRWNSSKTCREAHALQILLQPYPDYKLGVAASVCNKTEDPLRDVTMTIDFSDMSIAGCVVCDSTFRRGNVDSYTGRNRYALSPYRLGGSWPTFTANWDCINPGENGYITFLLQFQEAGLATATVSAVGAELPAETFSDSVDNVLLIGTTTDDCCSSEVV